MPSDIKEYNDVVAFHTKFGIKVYQPGFPMDLDAFRFRMKFFQEELAEYKDAKTNHEEADALVDYVYITYGCIHIMGYCPDEQLSRVFVEPVMYESREAVIRSLSAFIGVFQYGFENRLYDTCMTALTHMHIVCKQAAIHRGYDWDSLWNIVQTCNMNKELANCQTKSKRGYKFDIIKPEGWEGPDFSTVMKEEPING